MAINVSSDTGQSEEENYCITSTTLYDIKLYQLFFRRGGEIFNAQIGHAQ